MPEPLATPKQPSPEVDSMFSRENGSSSVDDSRAAGTFLSRLKPYFSIARPDHWFKVVFMLAGIVLAIFYDYTTFRDNFSWLTLVLAVASACIVASSNYVINEILDAPTDSAHPVKRNRPIPSGEISLPIAYAEWIGLGILGLAMAWQVNMPYFIVSAALLVMGLIYNIPPLRSKELPYADVITESINNPIRLLMGWFVVLPSVIPPVSLLVAYWMVGAFFMASKRFAEYRSIDDPEAAGRYRKSFRYYDDNRLLVSMFFYAASSALMLGVFIIRYKLELLLSVPLIAGFFSFYMHVTLKPDSPVQNPEHLYREKWLMVYLIVCVLAFFGLMFTEIPVLYDLFNVEPSRLDPLWKFGSP